jgi:hypothetical protein
VQNSLFGSDGGRYVPTSTGKESLSCSAQLVPLLIDLISERFLTNRHNNS